MVHILLAAVRALCLVLPLTLLLVYPGSLFQCVASEVLENEMYFFTVLAYGFLASLSTTVAAGDTFHRFLSVSFLHQLWSMRWGRATHHYCRSPKQSKAGVSGFNPLTQSFLVVVLVLICCWGKLM